MKLGEKIRDLRLSMGHKTPESFAEWAGTSGRLVRMWEAEECKPNWGHQKKMVNKGISPNFFFDGVDA